MKVKFNLENPAKRSGGDKYKAEGFANFTVYFPQEISRTQGVVKSEITIDILTD